jgi:hypothetical protein
MSRSEIFNERKNNINVESKVDEYVGEISEGNEFLIYK